MCACEREVCLRGAFVGCCFACGCVLELVVCRVRFARVSCPRLRFVHGSVPGNGRGKACASARASGLLASLGRGLGVWMVVRFVCVISVCPCAPVCPVCVPAPPGVFLPVCVPAPPGVFEPVSPLRARRQNTQRFDLSTKAQRQFQRVRALHGLGRRDERAS